MPYFVHREELEAKTENPVAWQQINLMNEVIAAELDAGVELNILTAGTATNHHYHSGCEHYIFIIKGEGALQLVDGDHSVATGYMIAIDSEEQHALKNVGQEDLEYLEFFVPGTGTTTVVSD